MTILMLSYKLVENVLGLRKDQFSFHFFHDFTGFRGLKTIAARRWDTYVDGWSVSAFITWRFISYFVETVLEYMI